MLDTDNVTLDTEYYSKFCSRILGEIAAAGGSVLQIARDSEASESAGVANFISSDLRRPTSFMQGADRILWRCCWLK